MFSITGGMVGLVGAVVVGPRLGRFPRGQPPREIPGHSSVLAALGTSLLWFGFYGFNPGSTGGLSGTKYLVTQRVAVVTTLCCAGGALMAMVWDRVETKRYNLNPVLNGSLAGLAASTSPCAVIQPWAALLVGIFSGIALMASSKLLLKLKIDDPVDAVPVHLFPGIAGVFSTGLFADPDLVYQVYGDARKPGLFMGGGPTQLGMQILGIISVGTWCAVWSILVFVLLNKLHLLRSEHDNELSGLDNAKHGGSSYPDFITQLQSPL